jgi:Asp/Glu/hydantoin racemase
VPVVRIDEAMADEAVGRGPRIGVLATLRTTLEPTAELVEDRASAAGITVTVVPRLCEGAFEALADGDRAAHDELVRQGLRGISEEVDVVVLAQASMARLAEERFGGGQSIPVLSSPRLGMMRVAELVTRPAAAQLD